MSNRLEQEFPEVAWRASPPLAAGVPVEVMRAHMERARALRRRTVRRSARRAAAGLLGALVAAVAFVRRASHGLFERAGPRAPLPDPPSAQRVIVLSVACRALPRR
jgi:hypothetical protein